MNNIDIKPNSHKYKAEQKAAAEEREIKQVVSAGAVKTKKKSGLHKLSDIFIAEDASNVKSYIFMDVLVPAFKKAISDVVTNGIDMLLYGGSGRGKKTVGEKVSYRNYYDKRDDRPSAGSRPRFDYDDIVFDTRADAEAVRDQMEEVIAKYGFITVADMYDMCQLPQPYTSNKYGWMNIRNAEAVRMMGGGYILKLPKAMPLD